MSEPTVQPEAAEQRHLVPPSLNLPTADKMDEIIAGRKKAAPENTTAILRAGAVYTQVVIPANDEYEKQREGALQYVEGGEKNRVRRLAETTTEVTRLEGERTELREKAKGLRKDANGHATRAGVTLYPDEFSPEGFRNGVRRRLGGQEVGRADGRGPNAVDRAHAEMERARQLQDANVRRAEERARQEHAAAEQRRHAEQQWRLEEQRQRDSAEAARQAAMAASEKNREEALRRARGGFPMWLISFLEWMLVMIILIPAATMLTFVIAPKFDVDNEVLAQVAIFRPWTYLRGPVATPFMISYAALFLLTAFSHVATIMAFRLRRYPVAIIIFSSLILGLLGIDVWMEMQGFHERHELVVAAANAITPQMRHTNIWEWFPFAFFAGAPSIITKVGVALYKEFLKLWKKEEVEVAQTKAQQEADALTARVEKQLEVARNERLEAERRARATRDAEIEEERRTAEELVRAVKAAEAQLRAAEEAEQARISAFELKVSDFIANHEEAVTANTLIGELVEVQQDLASIEAQLNEAKVAQKTFSEPLAALPAKMLNDLLVARAAVLREFRKVNAILGLADPEPDVPSEPAPVPTPAAPGVTHRPWVARDTPGSPAVVSPAPPPSSGLNTYVDLARARAAAPQAVAPQPAPAPAVTPAVGSNGTSATNSAAPATPMKIADFDLPASDQGQVAIDTHVGTPAVDGVAPSSAIASHLADHPQGDQPS